MDLHRSDTLADWEKIPEEDWNKYQQRAAETNGWDTPANRLSVAGFGLVVAGVRRIKNNRPLSGFSLMAAGRAADLADGYVAHKTGTKSPKGEAIDAALDKTALLAVVGLDPRKGALVESGILSKEAASLLYAQNMANNLISVSAKLLEKELHPSSLGKKATFTQWVGVGAGVAAKIAEKRGMDQTEQAFRGLQKVSLATGLGLGFAATLGYAKDLKLESQEKELI